jgi:hypothetical protein
MFLRCENTKKIDTLFTKGIFFFKELSCYPQIALAPLDQALYGNDVTTPPALWRGAGGEVFNVRAVEWKQRRELLREAVRRCKPDLVIVDGIRCLHMNTVKE